MACNLCSSNRPLKKLFIKNKYLLRQCSNCGLVSYSFKQNYDSFLEQQYREGYFNGEETLRSYYNYQKDKPMIVRNFRWYLKQIKKYKKKGKLLDIGCAYGYFLELARESGFDCYGVDPSIYAIKEAKKKFGDHVERKPLSRLSFLPKTFDLITMFDVFEHLLEPQKDLERVRSVIKDNGILTISTGDQGSTWAKMMGRKWTFYNPPQHFNYFNKDNIKMILDQSGFEVINLVKNGKWLYLRYVLHLASTVGEGSFAKILYSLVKNNFLGRAPLFLKLNDNKVIFARKRK